MELWSPQNKRVATAVSDPDGWYQLNFKHTGKAQNYTVRWTNNGQVVASKQVTLKANAFAEVSFP